MTSATLFLPNTCSRNRCSAPRSYTLLTFVVLMVAVSLCPGEVGMHGTRHVLLRTDIESRKKLHLIAGIIPTSPWSVGLRINAPNDPPPAERFPILFAILFRLHITLTVLLSLAAVVAATPANTEGLRAIHLGSIDRKCGSHLTPEAISKKERTFLKRTKLLTRSPHLHDPGLLPRYLRQQGRRGRLHSVSP